MTYSLTLLNIVSGGLTLFMAARIILFIVRKEDTGGGTAWTGVAFFGLMGLGILGFGVDFLIQYFVNRFLLSPQFIWKNILGFVALAAVFFYDRWYARKVFVVVPKDFEGAIGLVYQVPRAKRLKRFFFAPNAKVTLPESRIIYTSSKMLGNDLVRTKFITEDGTPRSLLPHTTSSKKFLDILLINTTQKPVVCRIFYLTFDKKKDGSEQMAACEKIIRQAIERVN